MGVTSSVYGCIATGIRAEADSALLSAWFANLLRVVLRRLLSTLAEASVLIQHAIYNVVKRYCFFLHLFAIIPIAAYCTGACYDTIWGTSP